MFSKLFYTIMTVCLAAALTYGQGSTSLTLGYPGHWGHLSYTITGATLDAPTGSDTGFIGGRQYKGTLSGSMLTVSGNAISDNESGGPGTGDYYELVVSVTAGKEHKEYSYIAPRGEKLNRPFSLSVPIDPGATSGGFSIRLIEQNANYGARGWAVSGSLSRAAGSSIEPVAQVKNGVLARDVAFVSAASGAVNVRAKNATYGAELAQTLQSGNVVSCNAGSTLSVIIIDSQTEYIARCPGKLVIGENSVTGDIERAEPIASRLPKNLDLTGRALADPGNNNAGVNRLPQTWPVSGDDGETSLSIDEPDHRLMISNGRIGLVEISRSGNGYTGRINITGKGWESLRNVSLNNGIISFDRETAPMERYVGKFGNDGITGSFSAGGTTAKPWKAVIVNAASQTAKSSNVGAIEVGALDQRTISRPLPAMGAAAMAVRVKSQDVVVEVVVDEQGNVVSAEAISGHPLLRSAAEDAARMAEFTPLIQNGRAVRFKGTLTFRFDPTNAKSEPSPTTPAGVEKELFSNSNIYGVENGGKSPLLEFTQAVTITYIMTYHWNGGRGAPTGTITLINEDGTIFGPWRASGTAGQGGVPSANWEVRPNILIPAGRYQVIDSDPSTWAQNAQTGGKGMVVIKGIN